eukprot:gene12674-6570_t
MQKLLLLLVISLAVASIKLAPLNRCGNHECLPGIKETNFGVDLVDGTFKLPMFEITNKNNKQHKDTFRNKIYGVPDQYNVIYEEKSNEIVQLFKNKKEYMDYLSKEMGIKVERGKWLSKSPQVKNVEEITSRNLFQFAHVHQRFKNLRIFTTSLAEPTKKFEFEVEKLPEHYDFEAYGFFIKTFGTHFLKEAFFGGRAETQTSVDVKYIKKNGVRTTKGEASLEYTWLKLNDANLRSSRRDSMEYVIASGLKTVLRGGNSNFQIKDSKAWHETLKNGAMIVHYKVELISELLKDQLKKKLLLKAIVEYLQINGK